MKLVFNKLQKHQSFLLMILSSASFFLSNILAKKNFDNESFYTWNLYLSIIPVAFGLGALGTDQLFIRQGNVIGGTYRIPYTIFIKALLSVGVFSVATCFLLLYIGTDYIQSLSIALTCLSASLLLLCHNFYRVVSSFSISQLVLNCWKFFLLLLVGACAFHGGRAVNSIFIFSFISNILLAGYFYCTLPQKLLVSRGVNEVSVLQRENHLWLGFFMSLFILMCFGYLDRGIAGYMFSDMEFSVYIYMLTILLMPFSMVAYYIGFREVAYLKKAYNKKSMIKKLCFLSVATIIGYSLWFCIVYFTRGFTEVYLLQEFYFPTLILICAKTTYPLLSSIVGLKANARSIIFANGLSFFSIILSGVCLTQVANISVKVLLYWSAFVWGFRLIVYMYVANQIESYHEV